MNIIKILQAACPALKNEKNAKELILILALIINKGLPAELVERTLAGETKLSIEQLKKIIDGITPPKLGTKPKIG